MSIDEERALLVKQLEQVNDLSTLLAVRELLRHRLQVIDADTIQQYNQELEEAEARINKGEWISEGEAGERLRGWRNREP